MVSGGLVFVVDTNREPLPHHTPPSIHDSGGGPLREGGGNQNRNTVLFDPLVGREILAFQVGVDRHLEGAPSTDGRYEIKCDDAAPLASQIEGGVGE